ncbi:MAG: hypothetical protein ABS36_12505 [Acidobacteria bacterium SCN 69-37]|nr:MAG: hypothetical protein ABS36_12505 [Acidobacteria bacterium SCN 69-37]
MSSISSTHTHGRARRLVCAASLAAFALAASGFALAQAPAAGQKPTVDIMLTSRPSPPKTGDNTFEAMVKDASGKPITDAEVSALFYMEKMGNMPEMKNTVALKHQKEGRYVGTGQVMMAGKWDVTVSVKRAGKEIGSKKFPITAQ